MVCFAVSIDEMGGAATSAVSFDAFDKSLFNRRMVCHAKIIIAAEADDLAAIDNHLRLLCGFANSTYAVEVIRFSFFKL